MKKAILHIGSEKTGSTSIQSHLHTHKDRLEESSFTYHIGAGFISNYRLVILAHSNPDQDLLDLAGIENTPESIRKFRQEFAQTHTKAVKEFHKEHPVDSTAIYSSEHCQSRLTRKEDISTLKDFLDGLYDRVEVIVYIRRQDKYASSAHNTAIQSGNKNRFSFENIQPNGVYYDHYGMLELWGAVFDHDAIKVRIFEPNQLHKQSVVADFCKNIGWSEDENLYESKRNNERLPYSAQETLLEFNRIEDNHVVLRGHSKAELRQDLIRLLHSWSDEYGSVKPSKKQACEFYDHFRDTNQMLAEKWLSGIGFSDSFDDYPIEAEQPPVLNVQRLLDKAISACLGEVSLEEANLINVVGDCM